MYLQNTYSFHVFFLKPTFQDFSINMLLTRLKAVSRLKFDSKSKDCKKRRKLASMVVWTWQPASSLPLLRCCHNPIDISSRKKKRPRFGSKVYSDEEKSERNKVIVVWLQKFCTSLPNWITIYCKKRLKKCLCSLRHPPFARVCAKNLLCM